MCAPHPPPLINLSLLLFFTKAASSHANAPLLEPQKLVNFSVDQNLIRVWSFAVCVFFEAFRQPPVHRFALSVKPAVI